jgi:hypothetical protein
MKKEDYIKILNENEIYKSVLSQATDSNEKRMISAYAEDFIIKFFRNVVDPAKKILEKDPDALNKAYLEFEKSLINSGSQEK